MKRGFLKLFLLGGVFILHNAFAATVRGNVIIQRDTVRLSDLFDDLEPGEDRTLGPAPPLGQTIQVGGGQLIAIADEYGVDWVEQSSIAVVNITRAGKIIDKDFFLNILRKKMNLKENISIKLFNFDKIIVPSLEDNPIDVSDVYLDEKTGRFSVTVKRKHPLGDINKDSFLLNGIIYSKHSVLSFTHNMSSGDIISPNDVKLNDHYDGSYSSHYITNFDDIDGLSLKKNVFSGEVVTSDDFQKTIFIKRGDTVIITFKDQGLHLTAMGHALEAGERGKFIHVTNTSSNMVVNAKVVNSGEVEVQSGLSSYISH